MIIPEFLKKGDTIAVTALSHPINDETEKVRFESARKNLEERGYNVIFTDNVFNDPDRFGRSAPAEEKAVQFNALVADKRVKAIYSAAGGDFLAEILPYVDTELFKKNPKWVQGFSDNTSILYYLATKTDVCTAYGANFGDFGMVPWERSVSDGFGVLEGTVKEQTSFETYQDGFGRRETGLEGYAPDGKVEWKVMGGASGNNCKDICEKSHCGNGSAKMTGRLIGGCFDVIMNIAGTPFDGTRDFIEKYKKDGIIWYLESFDLHFEQMMESLWKMRCMGYFEGTKGIVFGRPLFYPTEGFDGTPLPTYEDVLKEKLSDLGVPVIMDADIGHKGPQFVMLNGALAEVSCEGGKGKVVYK